MKVIEFMGMPKAGKTTAIEVAKGYLKKNNKKVRVVYEGARVSPLDKNERFLYNSWSFHSTINRILEARLNYYDFILIDRGVYDHIAFSRTNGVFDKKNDYSNSINYYKKFGSLEDKIFLYMLKPGKAIEREKKNNPFLGRVFNEKFLTELYNSYTDLYLEILSDKNIALFNGEKSLDENTSELILNILSKEHIKLFKEEKIPKEKILEEIL